MNSLRPLLCLLLFPLPPFLRAEEWILTFAVKEQRTVEGPDSKTPSKTTTRDYHQTVALGADYLVLDDGRRKSVFDFAGKRMRWTEPAAGTMHEESLYAVPTGLEHELHNRATLGAAMRSANIEAAKIFDRFDCESELRVTSPSRTVFNTPAPKIDQTKIADAWEFRHAGELVVRFVPDSRPLPAQWRHRFVNFLAYNCSLHADIRHAIAETGAIPQELVFTWRAMNATTTRSLRLVSSAPSIGDSSGLRNDLQPAATDRKLDAALEPVVAAAATAGPRDAAPTIQFAQESIDGKRPLDALLALMEYSLQTGEPVADGMRRHQDAFSRDPDCQAYLGSFRQTDKATVEKNLATNKGISRTGLQKAYMLELQRANLLEAAGRPREAIEGFFQVLRGNPRHVGALHDLGWIYLRNYEHGKAWQCWDPARKLYPGHPMMRDVIRMEMDVEKSQPDFF